jgi:pimeloyl-ACP methyl ester carboxylesterase
MIPVHFGRSERLLFGIYTPAVEPRTRRGVVICNPWGMEALRAHRSLRQLSETMARSGLDVLRFDYSGAGDSFGDISSARLEDWIEDAELALDELGALAAVRQTAIMGLRLGSYVAAVAASRQPAMVDKVLMWEPVFRGAEHLDELHTERPGGRASDLGIAGFPMPEGFRKDLADASLSGLAQPRLKVQVVHSVAVPPTPPHDLRVKEMVVTHVAAQPCWIEEGDFGAGAVPADLLRRIVEWVR